MRSRPLLAGALLSAGALPLAAQVSFTGLGTAIPNLRVEDISPDGSAIVARNSSQAYLWTSTNPNWVALPGAVGVAGSYDVANGGAFVSATLPNPANSNLETAARWSASTGQWTFLPGLASSSGASLSAARDISADGSVVVGLAWAAPQQARAFRWDAGSGQTTNLGALASVGSSTANAVSADGAVAAGWDRSNATSEPRAARWIGPNQITLLGSLEPFNPINGRSESYAVSSNGQYIAGESATGQFTPLSWPKRHGFRWDAANGLLDLGTTAVNPLLAGEHSTIPTAISDDGLTVVGSAGLAPFGPGTPRTAFIWLEGAGMSEFRPWFVALGGSAAANWTLESAAGMSSNGTVVVGDGLNASGQREVWRAVLPSIASTYCTAKTNSLGCAPAMASSGVASATSFVPFLVIATDLINNKPGLMYYGLTPLSAPFQGGIKCVGQPSNRLPVLDSSGNAVGNDCSGTYVYNLSIPIQQGLDPTFSIGARVYIQCWSRDPASPSTTSLSNGLAFTVFP